MYFDPWMAFGFLEDGNGCGFETSRQLGKCRTLWGEREQAAQWFERVAELEQAQLMLPTSFDRQAESSYHCIQPAPSP